MDCFSDINNISSMELWGGGTSIDPFNNIIYKFGGYNPISGLSNILYKIHDTEISIYKNISKIFPSPRLFTDLIYNNNSIYVLGGITDMNHKFRVSCGVDDMWHFSLETCIWNLVKYSSNQCNMDNTLEYTNNKRVNVFEVVTILLFIIIYSSLFIFIIIDRKNKNNLFIRSLN